MQIGTPAGTAADRLEPRGDGEVNDNDTREKTRSSSPSTAAPLRLTFEARMTATISSWVS